VKVRDIVEEIVEEEAEETISIPLKENNKEHAQSHPSFTVPPLPLNLVIPTPKSSAQITNPYSGKKSGKHNNPFVHMNHDVASTTTSAASSMDRSNHGRHHLHHMVSNLDDTTPEQQQHVTIIPQPKRKANNPFIHMNHDTLTTMKQATTATSIDYDFYKQWIEQTAHILDRSSSAFTGKTSKTSDKKVIRRVIRRRKEKEKERDELDNDSTHGWQELPEIHSKLRRTQSMLDLETRKSSFLPMSPNIPPSSFIASPFDSFQFEEVLDHIAGILFFATYLPTSSRGYMFS
jgi:hypothetical protein